MNEEQAIANLNQKDDLSLRYYAAWWLGKFRVKSEASIDALLNALEDDQDRAPDGGFPLRRNAAKALGKLDNKRVVPALIVCLNCEDYYVRESASQALEMLGDDRAILPLMTLLQNSVQDEQLLPFSLETVTGKPHLHEPYEAIIEALGTLGAKNALILIKPFLKHTFPKVSYAAARAMYQLTEDASYGDILVEALQGKDLQLRRSALMDLGAIGYGESKLAIANAYAENSLKLIAMKGLLESEVKKGIEKEISLSESSIEIMNLMDNLL